MKKPKSKNSLEIEDYIRFTQTLSRLTTGKKSSIDRIMVRQALSRRKDWNILKDHNYGQLLLGRLANLDAQFFKIVSEEIEFIREGEKDADPERAATLRGWMFLWEKNRKFPTVNALFDYLKENEYWCRNWKRLDDFGRSDPSSSHRKKLCRICREYKIICAEDKPGRKSKLRT